MHTTFDEDRLREDFALHPPSGVPGGTTRLPRRLAGAAPDVAFVDTGFMPADPTGEDLGGGTLMEQATEDRTPDGNRAGDRGTGTGGAPPRPHAPAPTPWEALGVAADATWEEIQVAHRALLIQWHPDRHVTDPPDERDYAEARLAEVNAAFSKLKVHRRR